MKRKFVRRRTVVRPWAAAEEKLIIDNYKDKTIFELCEMLPDRTVESINCKIKQLKRKGKITGMRNLETIERAYKQREQRKEDQESE